MNWRTVKSKKSLDKYNQYFSKLSKSSQKAIVQEMCKFLQDYRQQDLFDQMAESKERDAADKSASMLLRVPRGRKRRAKARSH